MKPRDLALLRRLSEDLEARHARGEVFTEEETALLIGTRRVLRKRGQVKRGRSWGSE